jgi:hypothetical protein
MDTKNVVLWILGGGAVLVAISVVINVTIINPPNKDEASNPSGIAVPTQAEEQAREKLCAGLQEKIDAEGRPGWDGLSEGLRTEIEASNNLCTLQGDGKQY